MSSLLYGPGSETLAVAVLNSEELGQLGGTAALSVLLTVVLLLPARSAGLWSAGWRQPSEPQLAREPTLSAERASRCPR